MQSCLPCASWQAQALAAILGVATSRFLFSFLSWEMGYSCCFQKVCLLSGSWKHHLIKQALSRPASQRLWCPRPTMRLREGPPRSALQAGTRL